MIRNLLITLAFIATLTISSGCTCCKLFKTASPAGKLSDAEISANQKKVYDFIRSCGVYYIATVDGKQPRVRPFGTILIFENKLYIQTGKKKNVSQQIAKNAKVELCALKGETWLRLSGELVNDDRLAPKEAMLNAYPGLKKLYKADDSNTQVLYFSNATAIFYSFDKDPEELHF